MADAVDRFYARTNGQRINSAGGLFGECVAGVQNYTNNDLGIGGAPAFPVAYAKQMMGTRGDAFDSIYNTPDGVPQRGDIVVFNGNMGGGYGHTGVVVSANVNTLDVYQQNDPLASGMRVKTYNYNNVIGWLHPRVNNPAPAPTPKPAADNQGIVEAEGGLRARTEPNTQANFNWVYDNGETIVLVTRRKGESVQGNWGPTDWWYQTDKGWVSDGFVRTTADPANVPDYQAPPPPPQPVYSHRPTTGLFGIDVSAHQGVIDWPQIRNSVDFAIIKAGHTGQSYGGVQGNVDPYYQTNISACGMPYGSYWYGYPSLDAKEEARAFAGVVKNGCLFLDLEEQADNAVPWAIEFIEEVERLTNRPCHLYTYFNYAKEHPGLDQVFGKTYRKLWLAHYGIAANVEVPPTGLPKPVMHQYSSTGKLPGVSTNLDLNVYYTTLQSFEMLSDKIVAEEPTPPVVDPIEPPIEISPQPVENPGDNLPNITLFEKVVAWIKRLVESIIKKRSK